MGKYTDKAEFKIPRHIVQKGGVNPETIIVNKTLDYADSTYQLLKNTTGTLDVILPPVKEGAKFWIKSRASSSSNIVVKDQESPVNTITTLSSGQGVLVVSDGEYWWDVIKA